MVEGIIPRSWLLPSVSSIAKIKVHPGMLMKTKEREKKVSGARCPGNAGFSVLGSWGWESETSKVVTQNLRAFAEQRLQFLQGARPILLQEAGKGAVGQQAAAGLAGGAVVGLVAGVADALDFCAAARTRLIIAAMHCHLGPECGDVLRE